MHSITFLGIFCLWISHYASSSGTKSSVSIAVVTSDVTHTKVRLFRDSPRSLVERLNSKFQGTTSEDIATANLSFSEWVSIAFDFRAKLFYVLDRKTSNILSVADLHGNAKKTKIVFKGVSRKVTKIAYDWLRSSLYWADPSYQSIFRLDVTYHCVDTICKSSNKNEEALESASEKSVLTEIITDDLVGPCSVAVDPIRGFLYLADDNTEGISSLQRSSLLGDRRIRLLEGLIRPSGLTLDYKKNIIYWLERLSGTSVINRCHLEKLPCVPVRVSTVYESQLYDLDFYQDILISSDPYANRVIFIDIKTDQILRQNWPGSTFGVCVASVDRQPWPENFSAGSWTYKGSSFSNMSRNGVIFLTSEMSGVFVAPKTLAMGLTQSIPLLMLEETGITNMAVDVQRRHLFYFSRVSKSIFKVTLPESLEESSIIKKAEIVTAWVKNVSGLAVDWSTGNLYWSDDGYGRIMVSRHNGHHPKTLLSDMTSPNDLVIHSQLKYLFWTNGANEVYKIERSDLDGRNRIVVVDGDQLMTKPRHLTLDLRKNQLYWTSEKGVCGSSVDGFIENTCYLVNSMQSLDIMHDYFIWTEFTSGLRIADLRNNISTGSHLFRKIHFNDIIYYHVSRQPLEADPCGTVSESGIKERKRFRKRKHFEMRREMCDELCLPSGKSVTCACMTGHWLKSTGQCWKGHIEDLFWLFCDIRAGQMFKQFELLPDYYLVSTHRRFHISDLSLDNIDKRIFWIDNKSNMIYSQLFNSTNQAVNFAGGKNFNVTRLAMAPRSRLLYIVSSSGDVAVLSLITGYYTFILQLETWAVQYIHVDENKRLLYLTASSKTLKTNADTKLGAMLCSDLDGTNLRVLYVYDGQPCGIFAYNDDLFWADSVQQLILKGKIMETAFWVQPIIRLSGNAKPEHVYVRKDEVFFTDRSKPALQKFPINSSATISSAGLPYLNEISGLTFYDSSEVKEPFSQSSCDEIMVPKPFNQSVCLCHFESEDYSGAQCFNVSASLNSVALSSGLCKIKHQKNGVIEGGTVGSYVPQGSTVTVVCDPGFILSKRQITHETRMCSRGNWSSSDLCVSAINYTINGNSSHGYVIFKHSSLFYVPPGVTDVDVVCIGGGGGGFDACNKTADKNSFQAGHGGLSSFGTYLRAHGGLGGSVNKSGKGGVGKTLFGGNGHWGQPCQGGGAAGETTPSDVCELSQTSCLFCGAGGVLPYCPDCFFRKGGCAGVGSQRGQSEGDADNYGGGATGVSGGGSGGGGGYSRALVKVLPKQKINVRVGSGGQPSARLAGDGIVVVGWGSRLENLVGQDRKKSTEFCKPSRLISYEKENQQRCTN